MNQVVVMRSGLEIIGNMLRRERFRVLVGSIVPVFHGRLRTYTQKNIEIYGNRNMEG